MVVSKFERAVSFKLFYKKKRIDKEMKDGPDFGDDGWKPIAVVTVWAQKRSIALVNGSILLCSDRSRVESNLVGFVG